MACRRSKDTTRYPDAVASLHRTQTSPAAITEESMRADFVGADLELSWESRLSSSPPPPQLRKQSTNWHLRRTAMRMRMKYGRPAPQSFDLYKLCASCCVEFPPIRQSRTSRFEPRIASESNASAEQAGLEQWNGGPKKQVEHAEIEQLPPQTHFS
ncbi:hypothetical protein C8J57DRAFT_1480395 [Mycena rebaudengoi]|nr:hypothetical protein C8J57DRAFT_1480395 [Mycena rebaudengoi]